MIDRVALRMKYLDLNPAASEVARRLEVLLSRKLYDSAQRVLHEWCKDQERLGETDDEQPLVQLVKLGFLRDCEAEEILRSGCQTIGDLRVRLQELEFVPNSLGLSLKTIRRVELALRRIDNATVPRGSD